MSDHSAEAIWEVLERLVCQVRDLTLAFRQLSDSIDANTDAIRDAGRTAAPKKVSK